MHIVAVFAVETHIRAYISTDRPMPSVVIDGKQEGIGEVLSHYKHLAFLHPENEFRMTLLSPTSGVVNSFIMKPVRDGVWDSFSRGPEIEADMPKTGTQRYR